MTNSSLYPMLAKSQTGTPNPSWVLEPKFDGWRLVVSKVGGKLSIYTRTMKEQVGKLPHLEEAFLKVPFDFVLDGEVVAIDSYSTVGGEDVPIVDFSGTQSVMGSGVSEAVRKQKAEGDLTFVVFDCLSAKGDDLTSTPDSGRRIIAETIVEAVSEYTDHIMMTPRWTTWDETYFDLMVEAGGEGVMFKNPMGFYKTGRRDKCERSGDWLKMKAVFTADVVVTGYEDGKDGFAGLVGAVQFSQYVCHDCKRYGEDCDHRRAVLTYRGKCSGMDMAMRKEFTNNFAKYEGKCMEVKYFTSVGPKENFRHPNFVTMRKDKTAKECLWDE